MVVLSGPVRDTPPHIAQYPFEIVSQAKRVLHSFCLVFIWSHANIAEIPTIVWGGVAHPLRMLCKGETLRKGGG